MLIVENSEQQTLQQQLPDLTQVENSQPFYGSLLYIRFERQIDRPNIFTSVYVCVRLWKCF